MRCQKCGYISFDGRNTCSRCGRTFQIPEGLVGTSVDAESPNYLVAHQEAVTEEPSVADIVAEEPEVFEDEEIGDSPQESGEEFIATDQSVEEGAVAEEEEESGFEPEPLVAKEQDEPETLAEEAVDIEMADLSGGGDIGPVSEDIHVSGPSEAEDISSFDDLLAGMEAETPEIIPQTKDDGDSTKDMDALDLELEIDIDNEKS